MGVTRNTQVRRALGRSRLFFPAISMFGLLAAGCDSGGKGTLARNETPDAHVAPGGGESGPDAFPTHVSVEPADLTTDAEGLPLRVLVSGVGVDGAWLSTGAGLVDVSGAAVAVDRTVSTSSVGDITLDLAPASPLTTGWYSITLEPPAGVLLSGGEPEGPLPISRRADGAYESRFRIGSMPLLLAVAACASTDLGSLPKLILSFSEPVTLPSPLPLGVQINGNPTECVVYDVFGPQKVGLTCTPEMPADATISVTVSGGIVATAGGAPLRDATGATTMNVDLPPMPSPYVSCRTWRETRTPSQ
jgi:hypothetical protein